MYTRYAAPEHCRCKVHGAALLLVLPHIYSSQVPQQLGCNSLQLFKADFVRASIAFVLSSKDFYKRLPQPETCNCTDLLVDKEFE